MTPEIIWEIGKYMLVPTIGGILWWLWKIDRRQYEQVSEQLKAQIYSERAFVNKETFGNVIHRVEKTISDGLIEMRRELIEVIKKNGRQA